MTTSGTGRHIGVSFIGNLFAPFAAIVTAPILTHSLSVGERGMVAGATAPLLFALVVGTIGIPEAATHFIAANMASVRTVFLKSVLQVVVSGTLVFGLVWSLAPLIAPGNPDLQELIRLCGLALLPGLVSGLLRGVAAGLNLWTLIAAEKMTSAVCRLGLTASFAVAGILDVRSASYIMAASSSYGIVVYVIGGVYRNRRRSTKSVAAPGPSYGQLFSFGARIWIGTTAGIILSRIDQVLLPSLSSIEELAYYAVAVNVAELASVLIFAIRDVSFRAESAVADTSRTLTMARLALLGSGIIVIPLAGLAFLWIPFVFGEPYIASVVPTIILLVSAFINAPGSIAGSALSGRGMPQIRSYSVLIAAIVNVLLVVLLAPSLGAFGAALATLVAATLASTLCIVSLARKSQTKWVAYFTVGRAEFRLVLSQMARVSTRLKERF